MYGRDGLCRLKRKLSSQSWIEHESECRHGTGHFGYYRLSVVPTNAYYRNFSLGTSDAHSTCASD